MLFNECLGHLLTKYFLFASSKKEMKFLKITSHV